MLKNQVRFRRPKKWSKKIRPFLQGPESTKMKLSNLLSCNGCYELKIHIIAVPLLIFFILGDLSSEALARKSSKHHSGRNLYVRRSGHHRGHSRSKGKLKPKHKYYSNTWAVRFHPPHREIADRITKKHGFEILGQVCIWSFC